MALATAEGFRYGPEVNPRSLELGQWAVAVEVFFRPGVPSTGPSIGHREIEGRVKSLPCVDSEGGYVHLQLDPEGDQVSAPIKVLNIARGGAYYQRELVESKVHFYTPAVAS